MFIGSDGSLSRSCQAIPIKLAPRGRLALALMCFQQHRLDLRYFFVVQYASFINARCNSFLVNHDDLFQRRSSRLCSGKRCFVKRTGHEATRSVSFDAGIFAPHESDELGSAAVSPTGRHVAYSVVIPSKRREDLSTLASGLPIWMVGERIHVVELATGKSVPLGADGSNSFCPSWSPDGTKLAFYGDEGGVLRPWIFDVAKGMWTLAADLRIKVYVYSAAVMPPSWSPDGHEL